VLNIVHPLLPTKLANQKQESLCKLMLQQCFGIRNFGTFSMKISFCRVFFFLLESKFCSNKKNMGSARNQDRLLVPVEAVSFDCLVHWDLRENKTSSFPRYKWLSFFVIYGWSLVLCYKSEWVTIITCWTTFRFSHLYVTRIQPMGACVRLT